ncbi:hypothetical protein BsWGS_06632 [Bradybaena similaris]
MQLCTHLMYSFAKPEGLDIKPFEWNDDNMEWAQGMYAKVISMKRSKPDVKILLAIGGYNMGSGPFIPLVQTAQSRSTFSRNTIAFLRKRNFDGLDMDWEYPAARGSSPGDKQKFQLLMEELMRAFKEEATRTKKPRLLLTVAVPAGKTNIDNGYIADKLAKTVDFISIMTYDLHGGWESITGFNSPLYAHPDEKGNASQLSVHWASMYWVSLGAPKEKLNVGIATYGRSFTLEDPNRSDVLSPVLGTGDAGPYSREAGVLGYYEICEMMPTSKIVQVPSQKNPYLVRDNQWVGYDDVQSVKAKACYASTNGFGGILFWTIDFDDFAGNFCNQGPYPLITAAFNAMKDPSKCREEVPSQPQATKAPSGVVDKPPSRTHAEFRSVCYYTNWAQYRPGKGAFVPEHVDTDLCTHVIYAFAKPVGLDLQPFEWNDDNTEWSEGMYTRVIKLKNKKPSLKILLAAGGYNMGSEPFIPLVQSPQSRSTFSRNTIAFLRKRNFDGFDMDWEYPAARGSLPEDKIKFQLLMEELMRAFRQESINTGKPRLLLTVAVPAGKTNIDNGYIVDKLASTVDFISIMTYDLHGAWENFTGFNSPLYAHPDERGDAAQLSVDWASRYYVSRGAPRDMLNVGIATYGRSFTLRDPNRHAVLSGATGTGNAAPYSREPGVMSYYEVCDMMAGAHVVYVPSQKSPYLVKGNQWVGYDDVPSVTAKACYAYENYYGGILFWTVDFDDFSGLSCNQGPYPLIKAAYNTMKNPSSNGCAERDTRLMASASSNSDITIGTYGISSDKTGGGTHSLCRVTMFMFIKRMTFKAHMSKS